MAKKYEFKNYENYIVIHENNGKKFYKEFNGARMTISVYRELRKIYGDSCRIAKVVVNYGEEI